MAGEGRVEAVRGPGVGADRLDPDPNDWRLRSEPARALDRQSRRVRPGLTRIQEGPLVIDPSAPAGPVEQPACGQWPMVPLPGFDVGALGPVVRVPSAPG